MKEWTNEWVNAWVNEWMHTRLIEWMNAWMNEWVKQTINHWLNLWRNRRLVIMDKIRPWRPQRAPQDASRPKMGIFMKRIMKGNGHFRTQNQSPKTTRNGTVTGRPPTSNHIKHECIDEWMNYRMNQWMNKWMIEWMNE